MLPIELYKQEVKELTELFRTEWNDVRSIVKKTYPEARASLNLSGRTTPKFPVTGVCN